MLISKHFDPVMGIDIHILIIPPAGPVPIPHPHIALVFDPIDYVPILGATVKVGGLPRSTAGTAGKPVPHIPMGGPFSKPPMNENEIFMGSLTVLADGGPLSFTAVPSLSCHDIGMIAPPRKKKPKKSYGMVLPTSVVLSIPLGMPVLVGGAPTIDMMGLAMAGGFAALGGAFKKLRKMQKKSKRMKKMSDAIHKRANKAMDKLGIPPNMRNKIHKGICSVTGHPVDIASGKMFTDHIDFSLPGPLPLEWERTWYSTSVYDGPLGYGWHHSYDVKLCELDNAVAIRLADGRPIAFPALAVNEISFDRQENLTLSRDNEGYALDTSEGVRYRFFPLNNDNENQLLRSVESKSGDAIIQCQYNADGQLIRLVDSGNRIIQLTYTHDGKIHKIFLPEAQPNVTRDHTNSPLFCAVEHHYLNGMLVRVDDALQQSLKYFYDHRLLIKETLRTGLSFYFEYDGLDHNARCIRTWGDDGIYWRELQYDIDNNITWVKNSLGHVITYFHNGVLPHRIIDPMQHVSLIEYNEYSQIICDTNELGYKTRYEYDERGNTTKVINPDRTTFETHYDPQGNIHKIMDENGSEWSYEYDDQNRLVIEYDPEGNKTRYEYTNGNLTKIIDPGEHITLLGYDQNNNLCELSQDNQITRWQYDALGKIITMQDDRGNHRNLWRDALGRIIKTEEPDGNIRYIEYDAFDNAVYLKDQQYEISHTYQGMGKLSSRRQNGTSISFKYNREEQLTSITNEEGKVYQFDLDANGDVIAEVAFDGKMREYLRDPLGQVIRINRFNNRHTTFIYDPMGRATQVLYSDGTKELFEFRADGELTKASNEACVVQFERDLSGRVTKECLNDHWVASKYNANGSRIEIKSSLGFHQTIHRNELDDVTALSANQRFEATFKRDNWGLELQRDLPGGIRSRWSRDRLGRPVHQEVLRENIHGNHKSYYWGINDRLFKTINTAQQETTFNHDENGNLISANYGNGNFDLRMPDAVHNLFRTTHQKDRTYGPAGELLTATTPTGLIRYEYDTDGNLCRKIEKDTIEWRYEWFINGLLKKVIRPDGLQVTFQYDPLGRRISKTFNNKITRWVWDGDNPLHEWKEIVKIIGGHSDAIPLKALSDDANVNHRKAILQPIEPQGPPDKDIETAVEQVPITTWLFEPDSVTPMGMLVDDACYSIITDHLGTPSQIFDQHGEQVWAADIRIWGELHNLKGEVDFCPFRWPGQYEDTETGLYYNRYRYYDPAIGQYISQDPIRLEGGLDLYKYVTDPNTWADVFGLNVSSGKGRDHVTYRGTKGGKPYTGYASAPSSMGLSPDEIVSRRYKGDFAQFGGRAPTVVYSGSGAPGKHTARGLEQHYYEEDVRKHGKKNVANRQNPVGATNKRRKKYKAAKNRHLRGGCT